MISVATLALFAHVSAAGIMPQRIVPNKIVYPVGEKGWADVVFTNTSAKAERAPYVVTDSWDVDGSSREICRGEEALARKDYTTALKFFEESTTYPAKLQAGRPGENSAMERAVKAREQAGALKAILKEIE